MILALLGLGFLAAVFLWSLHDCQQVGDDGWEP